MYGPPIRSGYEEMAALIKMPPRRSTSVRKRWPSSGIDVLRLATKRPAKSSASILLSISDAPPAALLIIMMVRSLACTASTKEGASVAPCSTKALVASVRRSQTVTFRPAASSVRARPEPIKPVPITVIVLVIILFLIWARSARRVAYTPKAKR
ncbi:hypothetical protein D3C81_1577270 [compost metagenome]